jgi:uncharacterized protein YndB with AHSA1/START domain
MEPIDHSVTISRPREEIYEYLLDIANHAEFSDHYLVDWHMTREDTYGVGAGGSFRLKTRRARFGWGDMVIAESQPPYRMLLHGRTGKYNRIRALATYTLRPVANGTRVEYHYETQPDQFSDRILENTFLHGWQKRRSGRALRRLRSILEDGKERGQRATVEGPRTPAPVRPLAAPPSGSHG